MPERIAAFHFERTITDEVYANFFRDAEEAGIPVGQLVDQVDSLSVSKQRNVMLGLVATGDIDIEPVLDITKKHAPSRLAGWAHVIMSRLVEDDYSLALYSSKVPTELMDAYADGFEQLKELESGIAQVEAKDLPLIGQYPSESDLLPIGRGELFARIEASGEITFIADSFLSALKHAGRRNTPNSKVLLVNAHSSLINDPRYDSYPRLHWKRDNPTTANFQAVGSELENAYDLQAPSDRVQLADAVLAPYSP